MDKCRGLLDENPNIGDETGNDAKGVIWLARQPGQCTRHAARALTSGCFSRVYKPWCFTLAMVIDPLTKRVRI